MTHFIVGALVVFLAGTLGGLLGIGGGLIMVPLFIYYFKLDPKMAVGTSLCIIVPSTLVSSLKHFQQHTINPKVALSYVAFAMAGGFLGAMATQHISSDVLKRIFGVLLLVIGARMVAGK